MEVTKDMVSYVAELSRLKLNDEQIENARQFAFQLAQP